MNEQNLKPQNLRPENERIEIAQKGGNASGKARSFKSALKKAMTEAKEGKNGKLLNGYEMMSQSLLVQIAKGNVRAIEFAAKVLGEYKENMNVDANIEHKMVNKVNIDDLAEDERQALLALAEKNINKH